MQNDSPGAEAPIPAASRATHVVCREGFAYEVRGAGASLHIAQAGRAGTLRLLAMLSVGNVVFGVPAGSACLLLVPEPGAEIKAIPISELARDSEAFAHRVDGWVTHVADGARYVTQHDAAWALPLAVHDLSPSMRLAFGVSVVEAGSVALGPSDALAWCLCLSGSAEGLWGRAAGPQDAALPVLRTTPLHMVESGEVRVASSLELAHEGKLADTLAAFNRVLSARMEAWGRLQEATFARHVTHIADADAAALTSAMAELGTRAAGVMSSRSGLERPLLEIMRAVAEAAGASLPPDMARGRLAGASDEEALEVLASNAGLRTRQVRLRDGWWRTAGEGMVGRLRDGTPVALLPARSGWRLLKPAGAKPVAVDAAVADSLDARAHVLYRGFEQDADHPGRALARFVFRIVRGEMALIGVVSLLAGLMGLATPFLSGMLVQYVIPDGVRSEVAQLILAMLAVSFGVMGFELVRGLTVLRVESVLGSAVEGALWNRLLRLTPGFFRRYGAGDLAMRADAVNEIRRTVGFATITALISVVFSVVNLIVLFSYGLKPALLALGVCLVELILLAAMVAFNMHIQRRALANSGVMRTLTVQMFQGISKLRVSAAESRFFARWTRLFALDQSLHFRSNVVAGAMSAFGAGWNILIMAALIALVGFGGAKMTLGDYVTYSGVSGQFVAATLSLAGIIPALATMIPLWERALPILTEPTEDAGGRIQPGSLRGDIEAVRVTFSHPGAQPVLRDVSVKVRAGSFVAIVGPSGSGKSTLLRLLLGFEQPESGTVLIDDQDLRDLDAGAVRRQLGVVLQHSRIEAGSLYQNIVGAAPLSLEEASEAACLAGLGPDVAAMPMGLHTYVDDSGATLSGGQRQRLLLARAIARRPRIMLLDEATSALDNATQAHVMDTLSRMNITRVVVAHRLSTVRDADLIVVLSEGRVVEQGSYESLVEAGGLFRELIQRQLT